MRALVVYESVNGNARVVAGQVADGLRATCEVTLVPVAEVTADLLAGTDLLVVGGPVRGPGLGDLLESLGDRKDLAAAFDTGINGVPAVAGRATRSIARRLKRHGYLLIAAPESFLLTSQGTLPDVEAARARRWGAALGIIATFAHAA